MSFFKKLFGKKNEAQDTAGPDPVERHITTYAATMMTREELDKLQIGDPAEPHTRKPEAATAACWIDAADNPYKVRLLDCRSFATSMVSTTQDPKVAEQFLAQRSNDGSGYIGKFPQNGARAPIDLSFQTRNRQQVADGPVFKAGRMEEKWDVYKYFDFLYFVRSWSGDLEYFCNYLPAEGGFKVDLIVLDETKIDEQDPFYHFKVVEFLIYSHILGIPAPHPIPKSMPEDPGKIEQYSFSMFGNRGYFATYE